MPPRVSVVMSVYNGEQYLNEAVESILNQSFSDFEFVIVDDGSTDSSLRILKSFAARDARIYLLERAENRGLTICLNEGIRVASGDYIARMDADDVSLPQRLQEQVAFMDAHPDVGICGSWAELIGTHAGQVWKYPASHDEICASMLFANTFVHPAVMLRGATLRLHDLQYDRQIRYAQDYELWSRAMFLTRLANVEQVLLRYRVHEQGTGALHLEKQHQVHASIYRRLLSPLRLEYTLDELRLHQQIGTYQYEPGVEFLQKTRNWLERLARANRRVRAYSPRALSEILGERWTHVCSQSLAAPASLLFNIVKSPLPFYGAKGARKIWRGIRLASNRTLAFIKY